MTILNKVNEIKSALTNQLSQCADNDNLGLLDGFPGISLFYYGDYLLTRDESSVQMIEKILAESFSKINNTKLSPYYCNGLAGLASLISFYKTVGLIEKDELNESIDEINKYLLRSFNHALNMENLDFLHGCEGILNYFLSLNDSMAICDEYLNKLDDLKIKVDGKGIAWKSNVSNEGGNKLVYNLGMAHGMASTLMLLSKIVRDNKATNGIRARDLLLHSVEFYMSERATVDAGSIFPNYSSLDDNHNWSRLAWCYGDLGISIALWNAGDALGDHGIMQEAIDIGVKSTRRRIKDETGVVDAGICHGSAGISLIYMKFYELTGKVEFKNAADHWLQETINMAIFPDGLAGFKTWSKDGYYNESNLLEGIAGIGLVLISSQMRNNLEWSKCFLIS